VVSAGEKGKGTGCRRRQPTGGMTKSNPEKKTEQTWQGQQNGSLPFLPPTCHDNFLGSNQIEQDQSARPARNQIAATARWID
jgi:hypothetical protein